MLFTILLPIHRPPVFLPLAVDTVLSQTIGDFELFIVCDGAPAETAAYARELEQRDRRIRAFVHPKGVRHGELWRHAALEHAHGRYIAHINDDDLWFPCHLEEMARLLDDAEFGNLPLVNVDYSGRPHWWAGDLQDSNVRKRILASRFNIANLTVAGYRLEAYRRLPVGWSPAPRDVWSDHFMWRKFLSVPEMVCSTRFAITALHFPDPDESAMPLDEKYEFIARWRARVADAAERDKIVQQTMRQLLVDHAAEKASLVYANDWVFRSKAWKVTAPLRWMSRVLTQR